VIITRLIWSARQWVGATQESIDTFLRNFTGAMKELTQFAAIEKVDLMLENGPPEKGSPLETIECFSHVMKAVPELRFHLDVEAVAFDFEFLYSGK
jgi:sugar phosphate isomerase/epimerase